jgi:hypothetical protein
MNETSQTDMNEEEKKKNEIEMKSENGGEEWIRGKVSFQENKNLIKSFCIEFLSRFRQHRSPSTMKLSLV